jgi:hypothetical protein
MGQPIEELLALSPKADQSHASGAPSSNEGRKFEQPDRRKTFAFVVALALLACGEQLCSAQSIPAAPDRTGTSGVLRTAPIQDPRVLEQALLAEDPTEAAHLF